MTKLSNSSQEGARPWGRRERCRCILSRRRHCGKQARFWWPSALVVRAEQPGLQERAEANSHLTRIKITALLNALVVEKQVTHVPSANIGTIHAIPVGDRLVSSQRHASLYLRRSTRSQKRHNSTSLQVYFLSQSSASMPRIMVSKYPLNWAESISSEWNWTQARWSFNFLPGDVSVSQTQAHTRCQVTIAQHSPVSL